MTISVVLFDFHFTLVEGSCQLDVEITKLPHLLLHCLAETGTIPQPNSEIISRAETYYQQLRRRMRDTNEALSLQQRAARMLNVLGYNVPKDKIEQAISDVMDSCLPDVTMVAGADVAVRKLHSEAYSLGIVSTTGYTLSIDRGLDKLGLRSYFTHIVTSGEEGIYKSDPQIFIRTASRFGVPPNEAVHIGDQLENDVRPAKRAGLHTIWFTGTREASDAFFRDMWKPNPETLSMVDSEVSSMDALPEAVRNLKS